MQTIFALGGGSPPDAGLNKYIAELAGKPSPKLCFVGTASGDVDSYFDRIAEEFGRFDCAAKHLNLFRHPTADLRGYVLESDIVYVGGGNTRSMLAVWREWGVDVVLREAWEQGILLCGPSAGGICWFEQGTTDSIPGVLTPLDALGFLPGSFCPHYDSEPLRRPGYHRLIGDHTLKPGYAADDLVGLLFQGTELADIVSARPEAKAYRVEMVKGQVLETPLEPTVRLET